MRRGLSSCSNISSRGRTANGRQHQPSCSSNRSLGDGSLGRAMTFCRCSKLRSRVLRGGVSALRVASRSHGTRQSSCQVRRLWPQRARSTKRRSGQAHCDHTPRKMNRPQRRNPRSWSAIFLPNIVMSIATNGDLGCFFLMLQRLDSWPARHTVCVCWAVARWPKQTNVRPFQTHGIE